MSPEWIVLLIGGFVSVVLLVKLMLKRQKHLLDLLRKHAVGQLEWSRKKARAALIARRAALKKENPEGLSALTELTDLVNSAAKS
jgi:hypothetical protein